jgi:hypothetical protein
MGVGTSVISWCCPFVAGLLLGTLAAVPGCVAMLAHRCNMPTTIVGVTNSVLKPFVVRSHQEQQSRNFERVPFILILVLSAFLSDCVSQSPKHLCGLVNSLAMKNVFRHSTVLQRGIASRVFSPHARRRHRHLGQPLNTRTPRNQTQCLTSRAPQTLISTSERPCESP